MLRYYDEEDLANVLGFGKTLEGLHTLEGAGITLGVRKETDQWAYQRGTPAPVTTPQQEVPTRHAVAVRGKVRRSLDTIIA